LVDALGDEPGLFGWDIMNEPTSNITIWYAQEDEKASRERLVWSFVEHFCDVMRTLNPAVKITCGVAESKEIPLIAERVDFISFHDYSSTRAAISQTIAQASAYGDHYSKPILCTEMGCLARGNPYDMCIQAYSEHKVGFIIWELMIGKNMFPDIHGVVYPDGSVRDPSIAAALIGFFRHRGVSAIAPFINKENNSTKIIINAKALLCEEANPYDGQEYIDRLLICAEVVANHLECGELVPMCHPPSAKVIQMQSSCNDIPSAKALLHGLCEALMKVTHVM
jgi:hypothetical protein